MAAGISVLSQAYEEDILRVMSLILRIFQMLPLGRSTPNLSPVKLDSLMMVLVNTHNNVNNSSVSTRSQLFCLCKYTHSDATDCGGEWSLGEVHIGAEQHGQNRQGRKLHQLKTGMLPFSLASEPKEIFRFCCSLQTITQMLKAQSFKEGKNKINCNDFFGPG